MPKSKSVTAGEIPLYLLPRAIALQVNRMGDSVYRISVKRTHWHHYNISVRVKSLPKELAPGRWYPCPAGSQDPAPVQGEKIHNPDPGCVA